MAKNMVIAGAFGGRKVECVPALVDTYKGLLAAANSGNHWARLAVKELQALTTGRAGKPNVFVRSTGAVNTKVGNEEFYIFLPGIRATGEALPGGGYKIVNMVLDPGYFKATENNRPGLYRATYSNSNQWETEYSPDGAIINKENRVVAISDTRYGSPDEAAEAAAGKVVHAPGAPKKGRLFNSAGFDMHYSPVGSPLGGLRRYDANKSSEVHGSAKLLAEQMYAARNVKGVNWVSERGGSVVLTQAMELLVQQGVKLDKHAAFMVLPSSSPRKAIDLAHKLNLVKDEEFIKTGYVDSVNTVSSLSSAFARIKNDKDPYGWGSAVKEAGLGLLKQSAGLSVMTGLVALAGGASGATAPAMAAIISAANAGAKATGAVALAQGTVTWGHSLLEKHKN